MHISKQANGKWRVIVQDNNRRRSRVVNTEREARRIGAMLQVELGTQPETADMTVCDLINLHITETPLAVTTAADYGYLLGKLPQWFLDWRIEKVTTMMIDQAYRRLAAEGLTVHRVRRLHGLLQPAFSRAVRWGWIPHNPVSDARPPSKPDSRVTSPSVEVVGALLALADLQNPQFGCALRLVMVTGMRRGELCGLQWGDLDEDRGQIVVRRSISTTKGQPRHVANVKTGNKGHRVISLDLVTVRALKAQKARQNELALERGTGRCVWMFSNDGYQSWRTDYVTLTFSRLRDELGVDVHLHSLRHYVATQLIGAGMDIRTVAGRLGHSRPSTTADIYADFIPARDVEAADIMDRLLHGG
jgi:integrase